MQKQYFPEYAASALCSVIASYDSNIYLLKDNDGKTSEPYVQGHLQIFWVQTVSLWGSPLGSKKSVKGRLISREKKIMC